VAVHMTFRRFYRDRTDPGQCLTGDKRNNQLLDVNLHLDWQFGPFCSFQEAYRVPEMAGIGETR